MSIIERLADPEILKAMSVGEKLWGAVIVMIIGLLTCVAALTVIMYAIKLMHLIFKPKNEVGDESENKQLSPAESLTPLNIDDYADGSTVVTCPADGTVTTLNASEGACVKVGDLLLKLTVMGMENEIEAPVDGVVKHILVNTGDNVRKGSALVEM